MRSVSIAALLCAGLSLAPQIAHAQDTSAVAKLAQDTERTESLRAIKRLEHTYAQYAMFGMWSEMGKLFASNGVAVHGENTLKGPAAIAAFYRRAWGNGKEGLPAGGVHVIMSGEPIVNLSADGKTGKSRWHALEMLGQYKSGAYWLGAIAENDYVKENGVWKFARLDSRDQFAGAYENSWRIPGNNLPVVPYHYDPTQAGIPIPDASGPAPALAGSPQAALAKVAGRIQRLNDEDKILNLQNAYGYYMDRKMWSDVQDLFSADGVMDVAGVGQWKTPTGIRRGLEADGPEGLKHGQFFEHPQWDPVITVNADGTQAHGRGIELRMLGEADKGTSQWGVAVYDNRYVKDGGVWKIREMRLYQTLYADYQQGWGKSQIALTTPTGANAPDAKSPAAGWKVGGTDIPLFRDPNPATGKPVAYPAGMRAVGQGNLTGAAPATVAMAPTDVADGRRKLMMSRMWDGTENVSDAFGQWIDDFQWPMLGDLFAQKGSREEPFSGFFTGPEHITTAETTQWGPHRDDVPRTNIPIHMRLQPVIDSAADGRSANIRTRLFSIAASNNREGSFSGAMYPNDQVILENGVYKIWSVAIDEFYYTSPTYHGGWSAAKDPDPARLANRRPNILLIKYKPDILVSAINGGREDGFDGGTGTPIEWPAIKPMWFSYKNPVSGRAPQHYWPNCVTCDVAPQTSFEANGYLNPYPK